LLIFSRAEIGDGAVEAAAEAQAIRIRFPGHPIAGAPRLVLAIAQRFDGAMRLERYHGKDPRIEADIVAADTAAPIGKLHKIAAMAGELMHGASLGLYARQKQRRWTFKSCGASTSRLPQYRGGDEQQSQASHRR
jgi:hypothetical protein